MNKENLDTISLKEMFLILLKIASFTFGGGYTIVPVIKDEFAIKRNLISEDEMLDIVAIASSGPGSMAINCAILTGYRIHGLIGAILAAISSALPSLFIITIVSYFYRAFSENYYVQAALTGMGGIIAAILVWTSIDMIKRALKENPYISATIMVLAFIASYIININTGIIMLATGISGLIIYSLIEKYEGGKK